MYGAKSYALWSIALLLCAGACRADTVFLTNGVELNGTIVHQDEQTIVIRTANGKTRSIRRADVDTIIREKPAVVAAKEDPPVPVPPTALPSAKPVVTETVKVDPPKTETPTKPDFTRPETIKPEGVKIDNTRPDTLKPDGVRIDNTKPDTLKITAKLPASPENAPLDTLPPSTQPLAPPENPTRADTGAGPPPIGGFPENAKRMSRRKETLFADALAALKGPQKNPEDGSREAAANDIAALGPEVMPYLWAGVQSDEAEVRVTSMRLIGQMNGRNCIKRVIETFYMTMPEASQAATWNVPFVRAIKTTLPAITGQTFVTVEPNRPGVQDGLKKYIEWYNANFERLPRQIGEPDLDVTDPEYTKKLKELRQLKLAKREWAPPPNMPVDLVRGPATQVPDKGAAPIVRFDEREADKNFAKSIPKIERDDALKRPGVEPQVAPPRTEALKRDVDRRNQEEPKATTSSGNNRRDAVVPVPIDPKTKKADPLFRQQDLKKVDQ